MRYRTTKPEDLYAAREFISAGYNYAPNVREALPRIWEDLMRSGQLNTAVVEDPARPEKDRLLGTDRHAEIASLAPAFVDNQFHDQIPIVKIPC